MSDVIKDISVNSFITVGTHMKTTGNESCGLFVQRSSLTQSSQEIPEKFVT